MSEFYGVSNQAVTAPAATGSEAQPNIKEQALENGRQALAQMSTGESLKGAVLAVSAGEAYVQVGENAVVNARLDGAVNVVPGQNIIFEITNNSSGEVGLRALFTNLAQEQLAYKALDSAGILPNNQALQMVSDLIKEGMPIDRGTLNSVYRDILRFPDANPTELIQMNKIGLEVNENTIRQYSAMVNYEQNIQDTFGQVMKEIPEYLQNLARSNPGEAANVTKELLGLIVSQASGEEGEASLNETGLDKNMLSETTSVVGREMMAVTQLEEESLPQGAGAVNEDVINKNASSLIKDGTTVIEREAVNITDSSLKSAFSDLSVQERTEVIDLLKESGIPKDNPAIKYLQEGTGSTKEFFQAIQNEISDGKVNIKELLERPGFEKLFTKELANIKLLSPSEVDRDNVTQFYQKITSQAQHIAETLSHTLSGSESISQTLMQFTEQLDFMNALNQFVPYVQLPLKLNGEGQNGDLYVLANKKKKFSEDDTITALLHLDMTHLGSMSIFVKLKEKNVSTDFVLEKEEVLDFFMKHIDMLNERLEQRGFNATTRAALSKDQPALSEVLSKASGGAPAAMEQNGSLIEYLRFDVRA